MQFLFFSGMRNVVFFFLRNEKCSFFLLLGNEKCSFFPSREWEMWSNKASKFLFISDQQCCCCRPVRSIVNDCREEIFWFFFSFLISFLLFLIYFGLRTKPRTERRIPPVVKLFSQRWVKKERKGGGFVGRGLSQQQTWLPSVCHPTIISIISISSG